MRNKTRLLLTSVLVATSLLTTGCEIAYSDGERTGVVQKISKKGIFWKTYEGEMVMQGLRMRTTDTGAKMSNIWSFSVVNPTVANQVKAAAQSGNQVTLTYEEVLLPAIWNSATGYRITSVK